MVLGQCRCDEICWGECGFDGEKVKKRRRERKGEGEKKKSRRVREWQEPATLTDAADSAFHHTL